MGRKFGALVWITAIVIAGGSVFVTASLKETRLKEFRRQQECWQPGWIHVKLGEHVFRIEKKPFTYLSKNRVMINGEICSKAETTAIDIDYFKFYPTALEKKYTVGKIPQQPEGFALSVDAGYVLGAGIDQYTETQNIIKEDASKFIRVSEENYICKYTAVIRKQTVIMRCYCHPDTSEKCNSSYYWKDNIRFGFNELSTTHIPKDRWIEFYNDFLNYMQSLEVTGEEATP